LERAASFLWFATIEGIEGKERLAELTPESCLIAAEAVERVVGQLGVARTLIWLEGIELFRLA